MISSFLLGPDRVYRCAELQHIIWQAHGFGTRLANPPAALTLRQVHSDTVWNGQKLADRACEGDALVTDEIGLHIAVRTADCVPILLLDKRRRAVAAVHAGWRGSAAAIVRRTIEKMAADFGTDPVDILAAVGPSIQECCYEVGPEVAVQFGLTGKTHLNLPEANCRHLKAAGVPAEQIFESGLCTSCISEHFYSYRREPTNPGRMLSAIARLD